MKHQTKLTCPCGDIDFTLTYYTDNGKAETLYCPFCSVEIEDYNPPRDEDENEEDE